MMKMHMIWMCWKSRPRGKNLLPKLLGCSGRSQCVPILEEWNMTIWPVLHLWWFRHSCRQRCHHNHQEVTLAETSQCTSKTRLQKDSPLDVVLNVFVILLVNDLVQRFLLGQSFHLLNNTDITSYEHNLDFSRNFSFIESWADRWMDEHTDAFLKRRNSKLLQEGQEAIAVQLSSTRNYISWYPWIFMEDYACF